MDRDTNHDPIPNRNADGDAFSNAHPQHHTFKDGARDVHANTDSITHTNANIHPYPNANRDVDARFDPDAYAESTPHSDAAAGAE